MNVIVAVKQILDPAGITIRRDRERVFVNWEEYILEPGSKAALEAALRLRDGATSSAPVGEVASIRALCMGEPRADDALREALAMGCDEAFLLCDEGFRNADAAVTAHVLAAAVRKLGGADLIVTGREAGETGMGQIGPRLAGALGYAQVTGVVSFTAEEGALRATRRWGSGYARVTARLPAVVTVAPEAYPARLPHGARIMNAYQQWHVPVWTAADLDLDDAALAPLLAFRGESYAPPLEVGERIRGDAGSVAQELATILRLQRFVRNRGGGNGL